MQGRSGAIHRRSSESREGRASVRTPTLINAESLRAEVTVAQALEKYRARRSASGKRAVNHWLIDSKYFNATIAVAIVLNTIQLGLSVDLRGPRWDETWAVTEHVFTAVFTLEMLAKVCVLKRCYFHDRCNVVDFLLVTIAILDVWILTPLLSGKSFVGSLTMMRIIRLSRMFRMVRMIKLFRELIVLLDALAKSIATMFWIAVLVALTLYMYAIVCVEVIGRNESYESYSTDPEILNLAADSFNNFQYFGSIGRSIFSLFGLVTLSEWSTTARPVAEQQPFAVVVLVSFTLVTAFGVFNVLVGLVVEHALEASQALAMANAEERRFKQMAKVESIKQVITEMGLGSGDRHGITLAALESAVLNNSMLSELISDIDLPANFTLQELFTLIDASGDGNISGDELMAEMYRLLFCSDFQRLCVMRTSVNQVKSMIQSLRKELVEYRQCTNERRSCSACHEPQSRISHESRAPGSESELRSHCALLGEGYLKGAMDHAPVTEEGLDLRMEMKSMWSDLSSKLDILLMQSMRPPSGFPGQGLSVTSACHQNMGPCSHADFWLKSPRKPVDVGADAPALPEERGGSDQSFIGSQSLSTKPCSRSSRAGEDMQGGQSQLGVGAVGSHCPSAMSLGEAPKSLVSLQGPLQQTSQALPPGSQGNLDPTQDACNAGVSSTSAWTL